VWLARLPAPVLIAVEQEKRGVRFRVVTIVYAF